SRRRHTRSKRDWSSDVCSSDLYAPNAPFYVRGNATSTLPFGGSCAGTTDLILPPAHANRTVMCEWPVAAGTCRDGRECRAPRDRSEERRVGKGWGERGGAEQWK